MTFRLNINYIRALQSLSARAPTGVSGVIGPISSENICEMAKTEIYAHVKTPHFELDLHIPKLVNYIPPQYKLHQGPPGIRYEGADESLSGYRSYLQ